ncbi:MAG: hypothetical protein JST30_02535 [Armatimonadetes bacterium]|nr:hypothetical protein [Armatimonadota bacterium]
MKRPISERAVLWLLVTGMTIVVVSLGFGHILGIALSAWGLPADAVAVFFYSYGTLAGVLTFSAGLVFGLLRARGVWPKPVERTEHGAYVLSVAALNQRQEPVWNEGVFDGVKRFVRFQTPTGTLELVADVAHLGTLAEGMTGTLVYSGDRLVTFEPVVTADRTHWIR